MNFYSNLSYLSLILFIFGRRIEFYTKNPTFHDIKSCKLKDIGTLVEKHIFERGIENLLSTVTMNKEERISYKDVACPDVSTRLEFTYLRLDVPGKFKKFFKGWKIGKHIIVLNYQMTLLWLRMGKIQLCLQNS